jgi:protein involved in polysaccharide export with SLBB domain
MDLNNVELVRRDPNKEYPIKFSVDLNSIINGNLENNVDLLNWDVINVRRNINFDPPENIKINGEVRNPGGYTLLKRVETLDDIISRAGGYTDRAFSDGIKIFRDDTTQIILKNFNMPLMNGDSIIVPQHTSVVEIKGEIHHPGYVQYIKNKKLEYYIESAGGFTNKADKKSIMVIYANGDVDIKKSIHTPEILEGCHIVVQPEKEEKDFDVTSFLKETASIVASLATILFILTSTS